MGQVLDFLEKDTKGKCYRSHKYCVDSAYFSNIKYDDEEGQRISVKRSGETVTLKSTKSLRLLSQKIAQQDAPLFKYFLDGSRRVYKVDDIAYGQLLFPIIAGQIGVSCCQRMSRDEFKSCITKKQLVLSIPATANYDGRDNGSFFQNLTVKINEVKSLKNRGIRFDKILYYSDKKIEKSSDYHDRGVASIQVEMVENEKKVVRELVVAKKLNYETYLMKDGSLQYKKMSKGEFSDLAGIKDNYRSVVGVSKSFNPELSKDSKNKSYARVIADLPLFHRTPAFMYQTDMIGNVKFSIWYLRIRDVKNTVSPFEGVLKIEKILVTDKEQEIGLESDEVDLISANIINERTPVAYGHDSRWANHLYPVYLTEQFVKSQYLSDAHFLNLF